MQVTVTVLRSANGDIFKSFVYGKYAYKFELRIPIPILVIDDLSMSCEIALCWIPLDPTDDKSPRPGLHQGIS